MTTRQEIWCTCGHCHWTWSIMALPATIEVAATAMLDTCPNCVTKPKKLFLAHEHDIVAAQQRTPVTA